MDPVSSLNSNTSQLYVALDKGANTPYAAKTEKDTEKSSVSKTDKESKSTENDEGKKSELEQEVSSSYMIDLMDEDEDGVVTTKEILSYYKNLATTNKEVLDKQIENSKATIEEIKKESGDEKTVTTTTDDSKSTNTGKIVTPEEQAKKIEKQIGFKTGENPDAREIQQETKTKDIISENRKAMLSMHDNKNLPSFMANNTSTDNKTDATKSNVISIDRKQQETEPSPLELEKTSQNASSDKTETVSPLDITANQNKMATEEQKNPLAMDEEENSKAVTQDNVYDINDHKRQKAINSYQTVEQNITPLDYTSKISVNV